MGVTQSLCPRSRENSSSSLIDKLVFWFHKTVSEGGIIKPALKDALSHKGWGNSFLRAFRHKSKHSSLSAKIMNVPRHLWAQSHGSPGGPKSTVAELNTERKDTLASKRDSGSGTSPGPRDAKVWSHCSEDP